MRVLIALSISACLHLSMLIVWQYHTEPKEITEVSPLFFYVDLIEQANVMSVPDSEKIVVAKSLLKTKNPSYHHSQVQNFIADPYHSFLATADIERKALPISNINLSMFKNVFVSGLPVCLRLYINASGRVVEIKRKSVLEQDEEMVSRLEKLLYQMTFIPAKNHGVDVDSYQDIEFSFNA